MTYEARQIIQVESDGAVVSSVNPLPVDITPGAKVATQVLNVPLLAAGATTAIGDCTSIDLTGNPFLLALTVEATYAALATLGIRVHVLSSYDDIVWDTEDWDVWNPAFVAGGTIRETDDYDVCPMYLRVLIENLDPLQTVTNLAVVVTVGG